MDPFTLSTGVAGFLSLAIELVKILTDYTSQVKSAPRDAYDLLTEINALNDTLKRLITFLREEYTHGNFRETSTFCEVLALCKSKIEHLHPLLVSLSGRLSWPLKKKDCIEAAEILHHCTQTIAYSLTIDNCAFLSKTSREVIASLSEQRKTIDSLAKAFPTEMSKMSATLGEILSFVTTLDQFVVNMHQIKLGIRNLQLNMDAENLEKLLAWLSPLEPQKRHQDVQSSQLENTATWILQTEQFRSWQDSENKRPNDRVLGCYGSGKWHHSCLYDWDRTTKVGGKGKERDVEEMDMTA